MEDRSNGRVSSSGAHPAPPGPHPGRGLRRAGPPVRDRPVGDEDPVHHHPDRHPGQPDHRLPDPVDPDAVGVTGLPGRLESLVRSTPWLLEALRAARDVDLAFFDPARLDRARDAEVEQALAARLPGVPWDAKNQAAVHTWYGRVFGGRVAPLRSAADGVATWPETATAVAVRLLPDDRLQVVAPCGLDDLFGLVCRRNPRRVSFAHYHRRLRDKRVTERWPKVEIV